MMKKLLSCFLLIILSGCATTPNQTKSDIKNIMGACLNTTNRSDLLGVKVPAASNPFAGKLVVSALKMGTGSNTVDALVKILSSPSGPPVAVFGDDDEITAATIEAALSKLPANAQRSSRQLCFSNTVQLTPSTQQAAEAARIQLLAVHD
jgi:hypothetical protein